MSSSWHGRSLNPTVFWPEGNGINFEEHYLIMCNTVKLQTDARQLVSYLHPKIRRGLIVSLM